MNIAVCIKQVPDTETKVKISDDKKSIVENDINFILNPYDEFGVEEALKLTDPENITIISLGPDRVTSAIRSALAMGAKNAIHIKTDSTPSDPSVTAEALASVLKEGNYDLIFTGKQAIDDDHTQMASLLAEKMDIPAVNVVIKLAVDGGKVTAEREIEGAHEVVECQTPCIISTQRGLNEPRYASLKGIMGAKKVQIEAKDASLVDGQLEIVEYNYPAEKSAGKIVGDSADAVPELVRLLNEEAKVI
ncbi:MAG: electron transfer flavoprotein beta subunit/FixA family protein [Calditrichaeota bacterium]|nr:MAG: electron transfer flavoprotein beta subunit/FixA family protein [Calditrichota bacterium]MBL1205663.1 electron transfer flavoprotein beta subunit/FixA family protein [Calditrichota bacterium]NOG45491.1 electron transfer flavoprotein subunit beta/FixA family protein [Calditrichota bacterium]